MPDLPSSPPAYVPGVDAIRYWKPDAQARALDLLRQREVSPWRPFWCKNPGCDGHPHCVADKTVDCTNAYGHPWLQREDGAWVCDECGVGGRQVDEWAWEHARVDQRPPRWLDDWLTLLFSSGRGSGKTRSGSEITHKVTEFVPRIILVAPTGPDLRETMVEGLSGLLVTAAPGKLPLWEPSKKKLTWPNGCIALGYSAEEPDRLRGPQSGFIWADEPAFYPDPTAVWDNMQFGLRVKNKNRMPVKIVATTTPKPTAWMKDLVKEEDTVVRRVPTYANLVNLDPTYKKKILSRFEGTRMGKQELYGELLEDVEGALWQWDMFTWADVAPALVRIVVSIDPAGTVNKRSDKTGIIVIGLGADKRLYVLDDQTGKYSPAQWADKAMKAFDTFSADAIVVEKNYGGDMVKHTLENSSIGRQLLTRIVEVTSRRGKELRAEPIVALYEKKQVIHVGEKGALALLEGEQTEWVPGEGASPNRVDALVHGATELASRAMPTMVADPRRIAQHYRAPSPLRAV